MLTESDYIDRATGPRREPPATCYTCGADVPETPRFGNEAFCDACAWAGRDHVDPWLAVYGKPSPFQFTENGRAFICAWHDGFDRTHPANAGASHGICPTCLVKL